MVCIAICSDEHIVAEAGASLQPSPRTSSCWHEVRSLEEEPGHAAARCSLPRGFWPRCGGGPRQDRLARADRAGRLAVAGGARPAHELSAWLAAAGEVVRERFGVGGRDRQGRTRRGRRDPYRFRAAAGARLPGI